MPKKISFFAFTLFVAPILCAAGSNSSRLSDLRGESQQSISAALGLDVPQYHATCTNGVCKTVNAEQGLTARFSRAEVDTRTGNDHWKMTVRGYGYGNMLTPAARVFPRAVGNRVEYRRESFSEWYVNGPLGLEQGFTLSRRPGKVNGQPLTIAMAISGDLKALAEAGGRSLKLTRTNVEPVLRYAGLSARDADGKELAASLVVGRTELLIEVDDDAARYPLVIDPIIQNFTLAASDGMNKDAFGIAVGVDGNTIVVGAFEAKSRAGAAYVFVRPSSGWANMTQTAELSASDGQPLDFFGASVSVSGNTVVVGAPQATVNGTQFQGAAYVFVEPPTGWTDMTETAKLTPSDGVYASLFGSSVGISGSTVLVGAPGNGDNPIPGEGYVFVEPADGWINMRETAVLTASDGFDSDNFGTSVSISGSDAVVGAPDLCSCAPEVGADYIFSEPSGGWKTMTQTAKLTASDGKIGDAFGISTSINNGTVIAGSVDHEGEGAVYIFVKPKEGWADGTQNAELSTGSGPEGFGGAVSISGAIVVVGNSQVKGSAGRAYVFVKPAGGWRNTSKYNVAVGIPFSYGYDLFGISVGISGTTGVVGAMNAPTSPPCPGGECQPGPGEAFVFTEK